ncbi:host cell division inhibitor Icd-like protein [Raoultella ornithinolytica]|uniref:host cell division inhibitor Icd-like protein n=1 Tax=Raoultella ornithinolytica TaxID=54291 RepID=UPI002E0FFCAB
MFLAVLLDRSKSRLGFFSCIGIYQSCRVNIDGIYHSLLKQVLKTTPRSAGTLPRRLTKPLIGVTVMADKQHTQTRPEFTWLFLATPKHHPECSPIVLRFDADTEETARDAFPGWNLVFAAKIRAHAPCRVAFFDYATRRGWEFDSAVFQEVNHG